MRAIIIAAGHTGADEAGQCWEQEWDLIIGADGGASRALSWGLVPHLVIGDMDSLLNEDRAALAAQGCRFVVHPRAKDETDLELALTHAVQQGAREIVIMGALGARLDHTLANVLLLALPEFQGVSVRIVDGEGEVMMVRSGERASLKGKTGDLVSLLPVCGPAHGVTTAGLAWALEDDTLLFSSTRGISNEMTAPVAHIEVGRGYLLVVHGPSPEN